MCAKLQKCPKLIQECDTKPCMSQHYRNRILSNSHCSRKYQLHAHMFSVRIHLRPRAVLLELAVFRLRWQYVRLCGTKDTNSNHARCEVAQASANQVIAGRNANFYHKVGGCASALVPEFTGIAVSLENSPPSGLPQHGSVLGCVSNDIPQNKN
jgi:hypothetical protein